MSPRGAALAALVVTIALVAACSSNGGSSSSTASSGATTAPSTIAPSTTATTAPMACATPPATAPASTVRATQGRADVDGDGTDDTVTVYGTGTDAAPGPWYVAVDVGGAIGRRQVVIADADPDDANQNIRYLGVAEAGGAPVVFAVVGSGASATIVGLFQLVGCDLVRVQTPTKSLVTFTIGGTVTHLNGARCRGGHDLELLQALSDDGTTYSGSSAVAVVAVGALTAEPPTTVASIASADLPAYGGLDCPGVEPL